MGGKHAHVGSVDRQRVVCGWWAMDSARAVAMHVDRWCVHECVGYVGGQWVVCGWQACTYKWQSVYAYKGGV